MGRNITRFANRPAFHTLDLSLLERLLAKCGVDVGPLPADRAERVDALFDIFYTADERTLALHEALYSIMRLDNPNGMNLLLDLAAAEGLELQLPVYPEVGGAPSPATPRHVALKAYLDHRQIFDDANDLLAFVLPRAPLALQGVEENVRPVSQSDPGRDDFRAEVSEYFQSRYRGDFCRVRWFDEDEDLDVLIEHGRHLQTILRERMSEKEEAVTEPLTFHEIRSSTIKYDIKTGFVKITGEQDRDKQKLKELFATHVLKRPEFFDHADSDNLYTLAPVVEAGPKFRLERGPDAALRRWAIREIQFDEGERWQGRRKRRPRWGQTIWHVSNAVAHLGTVMPDLDWEAVRFTYMKIWLEFQLDGRKRPASATLKPPGILRGPQGQLEPHVLTFLQHNGLSRPR